MKTDTTYEEQPETKAQRKAEARRKREQEKLTRYLCEECREANRTGDTHPGVRHLPGLCDCPCR